MGATSLWKYRGQNVLAVGAHPDDIELAVGGTVARLAQEGADVTMAIVCSPNHLESRSAEARKAAEHLGARVELLFAEREMWVEDIKTHALVERLDRLVRELQPAALLTHAPSNFHNDHVLVHRPCTAAQRLAFFDMFCFYPTSCHPVTTPFNPQAYVDITSTVEKKMAAIDSHKTQFQCRGLTTDHYRRVAEEYGRLAGVAYAEALEVSRLIVD